MRNLSNNSLFTNTIKRRPLIFLYQYIYFKAVSLLEFQVICYVRVVREAVMKDRWINWGDIRARIYKNNSIFFLLKCFYHKYCRYFWVSLFKENLDNIETCRKEDKNFHNLNTNTGNVLTVFFFIRNFLCLLILFSLNNCDFHRKLSFFNSHITSCITSYQTYLHLLLKVKVGLSTCYNIYELLPINIYMSDYFFV